MTGPTTSLAKRDTANSAQVRAELEATRAKVEKSVAALKASVRVDWRRWVRRHPWNYLAGAVAIGLLLGSRRK